MKALTLRSFLLLFVHLCDSSNKNIYLLDLFTGCVEEFEDYCSPLIPQLTVRAVTELANTRDDILPGYTLSTLNKLDDDKSLSADGEVNITSAILENFYKELDFVMSLPNSSSSPIVLGSPFSFVNEYTVDISGSNRNFVQVCFGSTFAKLNDSLFFYRIGPNEAFFNKVRLELLVKNNWTRVGLLSSSGTFSSIAEDLEKKLRGADISIINIANFVIRGENIQDYLTDLKEKDIRIIIALITVTDVPLLMCAAYDIGLIDDDHVWILPEMNLNDIRRLANNTCDVDVVLGNALMVGENYHSENHSVPFRINDLDDLLIKYNNLSSVTNLMDIPGYKLSRVIADATWAVILALNHSVQLLAEKGWSLEESVNHSRVNQGISEIIRQSLNQIKFSGLSGEVDFSNKDSSSHSSKFVISGTFDTARVSQIINKSSCTVEIYKATNEMKLETYSGPCNYTWGNNVSEFPYPELPIGWLVFTGVFLVNFAVISFALVICNVALRNNKYMKTSSLTLNIAIIVGCAFLLFTSLLTLLTYEAKHCEINKTQFSGLCQVNFTFDTFGWNLICIFIFLKSWRLYRIQNNKLLEKNIRFISEKAIFIIMMMFLSPKVLLLVLQATLDRPKLDIKMDGSYQYSICQYQHFTIWAALSGVYNIVIVLCSLRQSLHVSRMAIKRIAILEGKISVLMIIIVTITTLSMEIISFVLYYADKYIEMTIVDISVVMSLSVTIISMIYIPKAYLMFNEVKKSTRAS